MVAQNANIDALLAKLSQSKPLPKASEALTSPVQQARSQVRDAVIDYSRTAPTLQQSLNKIAQGQQSSSNPALGVAAKIFGNPIVKTALLPVLAFDTGRRGVISGIREITDVLDSDPNTKGSFADFAKQTKDTSFGFGTAFPMEGWQGRIAGFVGDVVFDPLTWATLGGAVPARAALRGTGVLTREALGAIPRTGKAAKILGQYKPARFITPEGRNNLAVLTGNQARQINLLDDASAVALGLTKRTEQQINVIEKLVAQYGKTRVPKDIAKDIGLPNSGIYWFGSRVKMPLSGPVGKLLEFGIAGTRAKIVSQTTGAVGRMLTQLTPEGVTNDAVNVRDMRRALASGKATPEEANFYLKALDDNRERRVLDNFTKEEYQRNFNLEIANQPLIVKYKDTLAELIETPNRLASASAEELQAYEIVTNWFRKLATNVEAKMKLVDPNFKMNTLPNYFPHQQTQKALNYMDNLRNPFVEELRVYLKTDMADPSVAFSHRTLQEGKTFFGVTLTKEDVAKGVKGLNEIARTKGKIDFDFFETDALKVLSKYGDSYASEVSRANFMQRQFGPGGALEYLQEKGIYDLESMKSLEVAVRTGIKDVTANSRTVAATAGKLTGVLTDALDSLVRGGKKSVKTTKALSRSRQVDFLAAEKSMLSIKTAVDTLVAALENSGLKESGERLNKFGISGILANTVIDEPLEKIVGQLEFISARVRTLNEEIVNGTKTLEDYKSQLGDLNKFVEDLEREAKQFTTNLIEFDEIHDVLGAFINGKYSDNLMEAAEEGGGPGLTKVVGMLKSQTLRDRVDLTSATKRSPGGKLNKQKVETFWGEANASAEVLVLKQWLDPSNVIKQSDIKNLTIDNVRDIIARSAVASSGLGDLRKALVWMIIRDMDRSPTLLSSIVEQLKTPTGIKTVQGNSLASLVDDSGAVTRISKLKETIDRITKLNAVLTNSAKDAPGNTIIDGNSVQALRDQASQIADEILEKQLLHARANTSMYPSEMFALRRWSQLSTDYPNAIVSNPVEIEELFVNLRTAADAFPNVSGLQALEPSAVGAAEITIKALISGGIENQQLTYSHVQDFLELFVERLDLPKKSLSQMDAGLEEIRNLMAQQQVVRKQLDDSAARVKTELRDEFAAALDSRTYTETIMDYSNEALEYYIYSETKTQFNNLMDELAPYGIKPSYGVYQRLLGDIAHNHVIKTQMIQEQVQDAETILRQIQVDIANISATARPPTLVNPTTGQRSTSVFVSAPSKGSALRIALSKAFSNPEDAKILDTVFPEIRSAVSTKSGGYTDMSRAQARDTTLNELRNRLTTMLREVADQDPGQAGVKQRAGYVGKPLTDKQAANLPASLGNAFGTPAPYVKQKSINELIAQIQGNQNNTRDILKLIQTIRKTLGNRVSAPTMLQIENVLTDVTAQATVRIDALKAEQLASKEALRLAGLPTGRRSSAKAISTQKGLANANYNFGLAGSLSQALESTGNKKVNLFFGNIFGGTVIDKSNQFTKYTGIAKTVRQENNQNAIYKVINYDDSTLGIINRKLSERQIALLSTTDFDYDVAGIAAVGSVLPDLTLGLGASRTAYGIKAYAEILIDRAKEIEATIQSNEVFANTVRRLRKQVDELSGVPVERQLLDLIKQEEVTISGRNLFRVSPQTNISTLPKPIQASIIQGRQLKIAIKKILETDEFMAANHEQTLNYVLHELASIDAYRAVNFDGSPGLFADESGLQPGRIWNGPRRNSNVNSNTDDLAVQNFISSQPEFLTSQPVSLPDGFTQRLERRTQNIFVDQSFQRDIEVGQRSKNILGQRNSIKNGVPNYGVYSMEEIPFNTNSSNFTDNNYVYLMQEDNGLKRVSEKDLALIDENDYSRIRVLKYSAKQTKAKTVQYDSAIKPGTRYEPETTWVQLFPESEVMGQQKTGSESLITKPARPEVWVPSTEIISYEPAVPLLKTNFTPLEWESLFVPGPIQEKGKLAEFVKKSKRYDDSRLRLTEMARNPRLTKKERDAIIVSRNKADKAFQTVSRQLDLYKSRTGARAKLNALVRTFENPETARLLNVSSKGGKSVSPQQVAQAFVMAQRKGLGPDNVPLLAADTTIVSKRRAGIKAHWKTTDESKVLAEVDQLQKQMNDLAFVQYSNSLEQQYGGYVDALDELLTITKNWTKSQSTVDNAKMITNVLKNPKVKAVFDAQKPKGIMTKATEKQIKKLITSGDSANEEEALALINAHNDVLKNRAEQTRGVAGILNEAPPQAPLEVASNAMQLRKDIVTPLETSTRLAVETKQLIEDLKFKEVLKTENITVIKSIIDNMTNAERTLLTAKVKRMEELALVDASRLSLIGDALRKAKVKGASKDPVERLVLLSEASEIAVASFDQKKLLKQLSDTALDDSTQMLEKLQDVMGGARGFKNPNSKDLDWIPEFEAWRDEAVELIKLLSKNKDVSPRTKTILTAWIDGVNALELSKVNLPYAQDALEAERGMKELFDRTGVGYNKIVKDLKDGYEYLNKDAMPNVMVKQAYAEILRNANSFRDPLAGATLNRVLKNWNSYWKPLATTTPGFHVRNNVGNVMALVFGGARMRNLPEATDVAFRWMTNTRNNISFEEFASTLTPVQRARAEGARWTVAATGGGVYSDVPLADNIVQRMPLVSASRKLGFESDSFARFVFSYDAMMQGFTPEQAAIRTKRFYIDYEDVSSFDKTMRQIVPFWMWTSRNVVTQVQNQWLNPKPYQIYNSFTRNFRDRDDDNAVSKSWTDLQAFKLPFGKDLYAMPDLGFTRVQQQLEAAKRPTQFLADVNPLLRVPVELVSGQQFYNERQFKDKPVQVEGFGVGSALQPLAQLLGMGETNQQGQKFIDEKFLYGATSLLPPVSIADRLRPSTGASAGQFSANTLAGLLGSPVKQLTPQMQKNELIRRLFEIQKVGARTEAVNNPQG